MVHPEDIYWALEASKAAFNSLSFILLKILKQNLKVAIEESELEESLSVNVQRYLTCYLSMK